MNADERRKARRRRRALHEPGRGALGPHEFCSAAVKAQPASRWGSTQPQTDPCRDRCPVPEDDDEGVAALLLDCKYQIRGAKPGSSSVASGTVSQGCGLDGQQSRCRRRSSAPCPSSSSASRPPAWAHLGVLALSCYRPRVNELSCATTGRWWWGAVHLAV
jgi:hypothetical protein